MLGQDDVEKLLRDGGYLNLMANAAADAVQDWHTLIGKEPTIMGEADSRERATFLNRRVVKQIEAALKDDPNVTIRSSKQSTLFTINEMVTFRCKKLTRQMKPMNIMTNRVQALWIRQHPLPGLLDDWINVTFGWELSAIATLKRTAIVFQSDQYQPWTLLFSADGVEEKLPNEIALPIVVDDEQPVVTTKIRDTERARRIAEERAKRDAGSAT